MAPLRCAAHVRLPRSHAVLRWQGGDRWPAITLDGPTLDGSTLTGTTRIGPALAGIMLAGTILVGAALAGIMLAGTILAGAAPASSPACHCSPHAPACPSAAGGQDALYCS